MPYKIGVVGNVYFDNISIVDQKMESLYSIFGRFILVSGHALGMNSVDERAEVWAKKKGLETDIREPETRNRPGFFARNKEIALASNFLLAFINEKIYKCGAWNTIKFLVEKEHDNSFAIIDEKGNVWDEKDYPDWLTKRLVVKDERRF